ncbi:integrase (plasmid) [Rhodococcus opacus]|uniref:integrase n=1 Tax=Rhodococcus opacus TaxID=37919 RepID=UPI001FF6F30B|nr:integrase [Rhodococcus opacus]UOT08452.1 integrase [Rhodococcus opacus]
MIETTPVTGPSPARPAGAPAPTASGHPGPPVLSADAERRILAALQQRHAPSTVRNYRQDWAKFAAWCALRGHREMPAHPHAVADYLTEHADARTQTGDRAYSTATLTRWVASINYWHRACAQAAPGESQIIKDTLSGLRRTYARSGDRPPKRAAPLLVADLERILSASRGDATTWVTRARERRDSALLLLGFAGACRRSELSALVLADVTAHRHDGLHLRIRTSKTDQTGDGQVKGVPYTVRHLTCPPCAYRRWLDVVAAFDRTGRPGVIRLLHDQDEFDDHACRTAAPTAPDPAAAVFRAIRANGNIGATALSGPAIHAAIRRRAALAGYPDDVVTQLGGHSLRAGFVTQGFLNRAHPHEIMRQTGHVNPATLEIYAREHAPLQNNAVTRIGL